MERAVAKFYRTYSGRTVAFGYNVQDGTLDPDAISWDDCQGDWKPTSTNSAGLQLMKYIGVPRHVIIDGDDITAICDRDMSYIMHFVGAPLIYEFRMMRTPE